MLSTLSDMAASAHVSIMVATYNPMPRSWMPHSEGMRLVCCDLPVTNQSDWLFFFHLASWPVSTNTSSSYYRRCSRDQGSIMILLLSFRVDIILLLAVSKPTSTKLWQANYVAVNYLCVTVEIHA